MRGPFGTQTNPRNQTPVAMSQRIDSQLNKSAADAIRNLRADTAIGMVASQAATFFIIICTAATPKPPDHHAPAQ